MTCRQGIGRKPLIVSGRRRFSRILFACTALAGLGLGSFSAQAEDFVFADQEIKSDPITITEDSSLLTSAGGTEDASQSGDITTAAPFILTINPIDAEDKLTITGIISGDGSLATAGSGTIIISGDNTFTGGISLAGDGLVRGNTETAFGTGVITFDSADVFLTLADEISIGNDIDLVTNGTLGTESGGNDQATFTGDIDTMGNTLTVNTIDGSDTTTLTGVLSGAGDLIVLGSGTTRLSGANTFTGGISLDGDGITAALSDGAFGTGTVIFNNAGATVSIENGVDLTNNFDLMTAGAIESADTGVDVATVSGNIDTMGNALTLSASEGADELIISGIISGAGAVTVGGPGTTTFDAANTYTGGTTVDGTLLINGSVAGTVTVNADGTVGGTGTLDDLVVSGGVSPGESMGTLTVSNDVTFNNGSTFTVEIADSGATDLLAAGGMATLNSGATVEALLVPGVFTPGQTFTILTAPGGVTGTFGSVTSSLSFVNLGLNHNANDVEIEILSIITLATIMSESTYGSAVTTANSSAGENAIDLQNAVTIELTGDAAAFDFDDANTLFLLGNDATINGNGFTALQLTSGILNISALTINGAVLLEGGRLELSTDIEIGDLTGTVDADLDIGSSTLTINQDADTTYSGLLSGSGNIIKNGAGVMTFDGTALFSGDFTLSGDGGLVIGSNDALGTGKIIFDNAMADIVVVDAVIFSNAIDLMSDATLRSFPGDLPVDDDTILDVDGNPIKFASTVSGNIDTMTSVLTLDAVDEDDQLSVLGTISGDGSLRTVGPGIVVISGNNTFTGGVSLEGESSTFAALSDSFGTGTVTFNSADATLGILTGINVGNAIDLATDGTIATLEGAVEEGEASGDIDTMGNALTARAEDEEDRLTLSGVISGTGPVTVAGLGTTVFSGANTYTGGTTVDTGTLLVNGSVVGPTTVNADGTIGGTGTLNGTTTAFGTVSPGESVGTLTQMGDAIFETGSTLFVEVNTDATSDLFDVTGTMTINGGTLVVGADTNTFIDLPDFTAASAAGGITGSFDGTEGAFSFLLPTAEVVGNDLVVSIDLAEITPFAETENQTAFAEIFDDSLRGEDLSDDLVEALDALYTDLGAAPENIDQLTGEGVHTFAALSFEQLNLRNRTLTRHINETRRCYAGNREDAKFDANCDLSNIQSRRGPSLTREGNVRPQTAVWGNGILWLNGYGGTASGSNSSVGNFHVVGFDAGYDRWVGGSWLIGFSTGYARIQGDNFGSVTRGEIEYGHLSLHSSFRLPGAFYINNILTASFGDMESSRSIEIADLTRQADALYTGKTVSAFAEVGWDQYFGRAHVQPFATVQYAYVSQNGFTESGAGDLNLTVAKNKITSFQASVGIRASTLIKVSKKFTIRPEVRAGYIQEFGEAGDPLISKVDLLTLPAATTTNVTSFSPFQDGMFFGASVDFKTSERFHVILDYDLLLSNLYDIHTGTSRVQWLF